jgi:hypothetical protein
MTRSLLHLTHGAAWLVAASLWCTSADAQMGFVAPMPDYFEWSYHASFDVEYQSSATIDAASGGGAFDTLEFAGAVGLGGPLSNSVRFTLDSAYAQTQYDFSPATGFGCAGGASCTPWEDINTLDVWASLALIVNDSVHLIATVPVRWSGETGSDKGGVTAGFVGAVRVSIAERFTTIIGIGVQNELADDTRVYPVIGLDWRFMDSLRLLTRGSPYQGGDATLVWGANDGLQLYGSIGYERRRFQLSQSRDVPSGAAEYRSVPLLVGLKVNFARTSYFALEAGVATGGSLRIDDRDGNSQGRADFDAAGLVRALAKVRF